MKKFQKNKFSKPKSSTSGLAKAIAGVVCVAAGVTGGYFLGNNVPKSTTANVSQVETKQNDNSRVEELLRQKEELQTQISTKTNQIEELQAQIEKLQTQIENAEEIDVESLENQIQELTEEIEGLNSELEELTSELEEMDAILSSVTQDYVMVRYNFDTPIEKKTFTYMLRRDGDISSKSLDEYICSVINEGYHLTGFKIGEDNHLYKSDDVILETIQNPSIDTLDINYQFEESVTGWYFGDNQYDLTYKSWEDLVSDGDITIVDGAITNVNKNLNGQLIIKNDQNINSIGSNAFQSSKVNHILTDENIKSIGNNAFQSSKLTTFNFKSVEQIGSYAFMSLKFADYKIPDTLESVGAYAFYGSNLKDIYLSENFTTYNEFAFGNMEELRIHLSDDNTKFTMEDGILYSKDKSILYLCTNACNSNIIVSPITAIIKGGAFGAKLNKESINLSNVQTIDASSFLYATINQIYLSKYITNISVQAFSDCKASNIIIPEDSLLTSISVQAFANCSNLQSLYLPKQLESIGTNALSRCTNLTMISVNEQNTNFEFENGVLYKHNGSTLDIVFAVQSLTNVTIKTGVTEIPQAIFQGNQNIISVTLPDSATIIKSSAFLNCYNLQHVTLGNGLQTIEASAFSGCTSLTNIILPSTLTTIYAEAFRSCPIVLVIPTNVTSIGSNVFTSAFAVVYCEATQKPQYGWNNSWIASLTKKYWYSETENTDGNHWHYVNGQPVVWVAVEE